QQENRKIDQANCIDAIDRMFTMGRQPIKMFRAVMHRMKPPKKRDFVLQAMPPIHKKITQKNHLDRLQPQRLISNRFMKARRNHPLQPPSPGVQHPHDQSGKHKILPQEKEKIQPPLGA
ncbi:MAG: hypothetical protein P1U90_03635, partial [Akkermansiaceae bacterium]|nr:hypothetical protein [Akkermansiaceae bacterium]